MLSPPICIYIKNHLLPCPLCFYLPIYLALYLGNIVLLFVCCILGWIKPMWVGFEIMEELSGYYYVLMSVAIGFYRKGPTHNLT